MHLIPLLVVLGIGALVANSVHKARKRDRKKVEAFEAQNRG